MYTVEELDRRAGNKQVFPPISSPVHCHNRGCRSRFVPQQMLYWAVSVRTLPVFHHLWYHAPDLFSLLPIWTSVVTLYLLWRKLRANLFWCLKLGRHYAYIYIRHAKEVIWFGSRTICLQCIFTNNGIMCQMSIPGVSCMCLESQWLEDLKGAFKRDIWDVTMVHRLSLCSTRREHDLCVPCMLFAMYCTTANTDKTQFCSNSLL